MLWDFSWLTPLVMAILAAVPCGTPTVRNGGLLSVPPAPMHQADPADSVYRAARAALGRREYRQAAQLFASIETRYPKSQYAADARYWPATAMPTLQPQLRPRLSSLPHHLPHQRRLLHPLRPHLLPLPRHLTRGSRSLRPLGRMGAARTTTTSKSLR